MFQLFFLLLQRAVCCDCSGMCVEAESSAASIRWSAGAAAAPRRVQGQVVRKVIVRHVTCCCVASSSTANSCDP